MACFVLVKLGWVTMLYVSIETNTLTNRGGHLSPLQDHVLGDSAVSVDINALIFITQQHLHTISLRKHHDGMRGHTALNLREREREKKGLFADHSAVLKETIRGPHSINIYSTQPWLIWAGGAPKNIHPLEISLYKIKS